MPVNTDQEYAEELIVEAHNRLNPHISQSFPNQHRMSHAIRDSQERIELYTKSMSKLLGISFSERHDLGFGNQLVMNLVNAACSDHGNLSILTVSHE